MAKSINKCYIPLIIDKGDKKRFRLGVAHDWSLRHRGSLKKMGKKRIETVVPILNKG